MSKNSDDSSDHDTAMDEDSSDDAFFSDYYEEEDFDYRFYINPIMDLLPPEMRPYIQRISTDAAYLFVKKEIVIRRVPHRPTFQEQLETCMDYGCNKLTSIKCSTCHVFVCLECFDNFHDTDD